MNEGVFSPEELAQRRRQAGRMAWLIGAAVLMIYLLGFLVKR